MDVVNLATSLHAGLPHLPVMGIDIIRERSTGRLYGRLPRLPRWRIEWGPALGNRAQPGEEEMKFSCILIAILTVCLASLCPGALTTALAQEASNSTETYGAWMVRCKREKDLNICEMLQTLATGTEKDRKIVAQVAIGQLPNTQAPRAVLQVPMGVDLTKPPVLIIGETAEYAGRYFICTGRFCRAEIDLPIAVAEEIGKAEKASMRFTLLGKKMVVLITTEGMAAAFKKALGKAD